jgi:predicted dehydrogenase
MSRAVSRIGVVGLGKVTQLHHLPALDQIDGLEIAAVCDLSAELTLAIAENYGLPADAAVSTVPTLLERKLDAILIATNHHGPVLRDAIAAGLPTFVEKPCTWGLDEGRELMSMAEDLGVNVMVGYMKRYDPAVERFQTAVGAEVPFFVRAHNFAGGRHRHERIHPVRKPGSDVDPSSAGAESSIVDAIIARNLGDDHPSRIAAFRTLAQLAIHDVNLVQALLGPVDTGRLSCHETPVGTYYEITLESGASRCRLEILADFTTSRDWDELIQCYRADGVAELVFPSPFVRNAPTLIRRRLAVDLEARVEEIMVSRESAYLRELTHFRDVVEGSIEPRTQLAEAVADLELLYDLVRHMDVDVP